MIMKIIAGLFNSGRVHTPVQFYKQDLLNARGMSFYKREAKKPIKIRFINSDGEHREGWFMIDRYRHSSYITHLRWKGTKEIVRHKKVTRIVETFIEGKENAFTRFIFGPSVYFIWNTHIV